MAASRPRFYSFGCITCERAAIVVVNEVTDYYNIFYSLSRSLRAHPVPTVTWVDTSGFRSCEGDTFFPIICRTCEYLRSREYNTADAQNDPNPYIAKPFLEDWELLQKLQRKARRRTGRDDAAVLGGDHKPRPVLKAALVRLLQQQGRLDEVDVNGNRPFFIS